MKVPKLHRVKVRGKEIGSYLVWIRGPKGKRSRVNLRTQDAGVARLRRAGAMQGRRTWDTDQEQLGRVVAAFDAAPPDPGPPAPAADVPRGTPEVEVIEGEIIPPPAPAANGWQDDAAAAAGSPAADGDAGAATEGGGAAFGIDEGFLHDLLGDAADMAVELQLWLHEAVFRWRGIQLGTVPAEHKSRELGRKGWQQVFTRLLPTNIPIPDYILVPIAVMMAALPAQLKDATEIKPPVPKANASARPPAASSPDAQGAAIA